MSRSQSEVGELVASIFDRLPVDWPGCEIQDALLVVEVSDPEDADATIILIESTTSRTTVREGILRMAVRSGVERDEAED